MRDTVPEFHAGTIVSYAKGHDRVVLIEEGWWVSLVNGDHVSTEDIFAEEWAVVSMGEAPVVDTIPEVRVYVPQPRDLVPPYTMVVLAEGQVVAIKCIDNKWRYVDNHALVEPEDFRESDVYHEPPSGLRATPRFGARRIPGGNSYAPTFAHRLMGQ